MAKGDLNRWLYRGKRPNALARIVNKASGALGATGLVHHGLARLETTGRKTGKITSLPVVVAEFERPEPEPIFRSDRMPRSRISR